MCWLQQSAQLWHCPTFLLPPLILLACIECFAGYRAWRFLLGFNGYILGFVAGALLCAQLGGSPVLLLAGAFVGGFIGAASFAMIAPLGSFVFIACSLASLAVIFLRAAGMPPHWVALIAASAALSTAVAVRAFCRLATIIVAAIGGAQQIASAWCAYQLPADQVPVPDIMDPVEWSAFLALAAAGLIVQFATCREPRAEPALGRPGGDSFAMSDQNESGT